MATKTKTAKRSAEQNAYLMARAKVECILDRVRAEMKATGLVMETEADVDAYTDAEMAIEGRLGLNAAYAAEREARTALFAWAHGKVKTLPEYNSHVADQIEGLFAEVGRHPHLVEKLVTISMQLRA